ncbi:MAG: aspartyl/asparaginyl beta-hydroxylase domain-containing protein [Defluviicoccus sp.]|nr:MAG: aspartyl/asparaginyl beta-hydroxylase domain-containing protein [Defluviicoccus sp.]
MNMRVNRELCPATTAVTDRLPGRVTSGFYLLGPQAHVEPHVGICENIKRCHLGLICPPECTFRIGNERRTWREGEMLVFDDTIEHEAWNRSDAMRVVLHLDFLTLPIRMRRRANAPCARYGNQHHVQNGSDHLWLSAVGVELDDDLSAIVEASVDRAKSRPEGIRRVAAVNNLVATCGFFY